MRTKFTRVVAVAAAVAAASVGLIANSASALPPGSPSAGLVTLSGTVGNLTVNPPSGAACPGDSTAAGGNYRWQTFLVSASVDPGTLTYNASGPIPQGATVALPLITTTGSPVVAQTTAITTGLITPIPVYSLTNIPAAAVPPSGAYNIGYACTQTGVTQKFWTSPVTLTNTAGAISAFAFGAVPAAPVLTSPLTVGNGTLAGTFTEAAATPAVTGYTVTAVPTAGSTVTLPLAAGATSFTLTGLVNGISYAVSLIATNTVGNSAASNTVNGTPALAPQPPVTNLVAAPGAAGSAVLTWIAPAGSATPTGYTIGVSPTVPGAPFSAAGSPATVSGLTAGTSYTFTVTALYNAPDTGTPATVTFIATGAQVIIQDITVVRPAGALILTQRCGVFGPLAAVPTTPVIPGFEAGFPAALAAGGLVGTAPTTGAAPGGPADPQFGNYPFPSPAAYPTHCGVDLGTGSFVTSGPLAGQYYSANGRLNQVTVADNRDGSFGGWTVNGTMSAFTNGSSTFSGDNLGWIPQVASTTAGQTVAAGGAVNPLTPAGLGSGRTLASSASATTARGIAQLDARLLLLIPVSAAAGTFTGTLTLSAI